MAGNPELWSDFDGTAIDIVRKTDWRNWFKAGIPILDGYIEFLYGAQEAGVDIAGVLSRRNDRARRGTTMHSIATLGLGEYFGDPAKVILAGSESAKGRYLAQRSLVGPVGMLEDKPHKLTPVVVGALTQEMIDGGTPHRIIIGAVDTPNMLDRLDQLGKEARATNGLTVNTSPGGLTIQHDAATIQIVPLPPYSYETGLIFGRTLANTA